MDGSVRIARYEVVPTEANVYAQLVVTVIGVKVEVTVPVTMQSLTAAAASQGRQAWDQSDLVTVVSGYFAALATRVSFG